MLLKNLYSAYNSAVAKSKTKLHQANKSINKNVIKSLNCSGTTRFPLSPTQSTGTSTSLRDNKPSALLTTSLFDTSLICLRHSSTTFVINFLSGPYKSSLEGSKLEPVYTLSCCWETSIGEIETLFKYILISSLLSVIEAKKKDLTFHHQLHHSKL